MEIKKPQPFTEVTEWVFTFDSGMELSFVVNDKAGDTVAVKDDAYIINLSDKPNQFDPDELIPGENIIVFRHSLAALQTRKRRQRLPTPEELIDMNKLLHQQPARVQ